MVKKLLLATTMLISASVASAQNLNVQPPDITGTPTIVAPLLESNPLLANRKQTPSDIPPIMAKELADIPTTNIIQVRPTGGISWCDIGSATGTGCGGAPGSEAKMRSTLGVTQILNDDPIRFWNQSGVSHGHIFFGNTCPANSTFATLRARSKKYSRAAGGGANGTCYWMPWMVEENKFGDGRNYVAIPLPVTLYYNEEPGKSSELKDLVRGKRYVSGYWVDDGGAYMQGILNTANAASAAAGGLANRYSVGNIRYSSTGQNWNCINSSDQVVPRTITGTGENHFVEADGSDPWGGTCTAGMKLKMLFDAGSCSDGQNLWVPGGFKHQLPQIYDSAFSEAVCPKNYFREPRLQLTIQYKHNGFVQYKNWKLSSDPIVGKANTGITNGQTLRRGETFHTDWFNGWDGSTLTMWNRWCLGTNGNTPHQCNSSTIGEFNRLITSDPNPQTGRSPQVDIFKSPANNSATGPDKMFLAPAVMKHTADIMAYMHGAPVNPGRTLFIEGDSISVCDTTGGALCTGSFTYAAQYAAAYNYAREYAFAVGGSGLSTLETRLSGLVAQKPATGPWMVTFHIGGNDLQNPQDMPSWLARMKAYVTALHNAGAKVVACTNIQNRSGTSTNIATDSAQRATYNAELRAMLGRGELEAVCDFAASPIMGSDTSYIDNPSHWTDVTHPSVLGHNVLMAIYAQAVSRGFQK